MHNEFYICDKMKMYEVYGGRKPHKNQTENIDGRDMSAIIHLAYSKKNKDAPENYNICGLRQATLENIKRRKHKI